MTGEEIRLHKGSVTLRNIILQKMYRIKHREEMGWTGVKCQDREMKKKKTTHHNCNNLLYTFQSLAATSIIIRLCCSCLL